MEYATLAVLILIIIILFNKKKVIRRTILNDRYDTDGTLLSYEIRVHYSDGTFRDSYVNMNNSSDSKIGI